MKILDEAKGYFKFMNEILQYFYIPFLALVIFCIIGSFFL